MKRKSKLLIGFALVAFFGLYMKNSTVKAYTQSNYDLGICTIYFADGTTHRGAHCWAPNPNGPCSRATECMNGAPPPQVE